MTRKLFYENGYTESFTAEVFSCKALSSGYEIVLDKTYFFAEGGGQPADTGYIGTAQVIDVQEQEGIIIHYTNEPLLEGSLVVGRIDFPRRFSFMQQHTGEHIVSGIINRLFGLDNVGFHMGKDYVTMDINGILTEEDLDKVEELSNKAVYENVPITAEYPTRETLESMTYRSKKDLLGDVRVVTVQGYDKCACCGLHCAYAGEVGLIKIISSQRYKGGMRINILCGQWAMKDYSMKNKNAYAISTLLSAKPHEITGAVKKLLDDISSLKQQLVEYKSETFNLKATQIPQDTDRAYFFENDITAGDLRRFCLVLCERVNLAAVFSGTDGEYKYAIGSNDMDIRNLGKEFNAVLNGKGGGQKELIQGTVYADRASIEAFLNEYDSLY